ncbi:MAG: zinc ABC transporter substrate-binding protein [Thermoanaerobaculales bacterium]|jgi:zinc transport system substrate-binding protein|nr:zinc ABC transporter substrate-binding protein [Thermoanaerobaculales bacterium]
MHAAARLVAACLAAAAIFSPSTAAAAAERPLVFVGIPPLAWVVEQLSDRFEVQVLLPPGASPHVYEPSPRQVASLDGARLYLQIGLPFEDPLLAKIKALMPGLRVVDCRQGIELVAMEEHGHDHADGWADPHIWLDPQRMAAVAATAAAALAELMPAQRHAIEDRLRALQSALGETDARIAGRLAPLRGRTLVVFHPAYGYFTRRYGLTQVAVEVEGKAPSARQLAAIVDSLEGLRVQAIFVQPQFSQIAAQRVADAIGCAVVELDPLAGDYLTNLDTMAGRIAAALGV